ncbi:unnamed protein product [Rotaria sordida]|uniref:Translation initiation factor 5A C-terminal domain-containing protein n=1 Tax=Rotaria sordida TaxID=392033 RepID=A0A814VFS9_9BILA|nr:unnamed protein product [Rotaria sordida]
MMMGERVKIIIYEARWFVDERGNVRWQDKQQKKTRRNQVVILQDHVIQQFPENIQKGLFKTIDERVWPTSRNISIREVEDRLFELLEPFTASGQVELICEQLDEQSKHLVEGNFDVLVGADGSNSFVRRYCNIQMISEGIEYACGVGYDVPEDISPSDQTLHQALNCILSASQTRYMVSSSLSCQGYLYIRLGKNEYEALRQCLQKVQNRDEPLDLPNRTKWPQSPILSIIREGLKFFNINEKFISRIAPIEINVRHASVVIRELRSEINLKEPKKILAFLVGDAAMNVHFWPGRGMNSGMKAAMALARNIQRSYIANILPHRQENHSSLPFLDFLDYESFMARLRAREQQGRSLRILASPIDLTLKGVPINPYPNYSYEEHREQLKKKLIDTREEFQGLPDWPHKTRSVTDTELEDVFNRIDWHTVTKLALANAWPTREMNGVEVLVEDMFPINQQSCLSLPKSAHKKPLTCQPTIASRRRFRILWIDGDTINESTQELIATIRASPEFVDLSSMLAQGSVQSYSSSVNILNKLDVFPTTISALNWIRENRKTIDEPDIRVKVIIRWPLHENKELVDVIRNIRTQVSRVPILVYTNEYEDTQMAFEFPSVIITNTTSDLYEFVGINQETQWDDDCSMSQEEQTPVKVVEVTHSKPGKNGRPKVCLVGIDIFTGNRYEDIRLAADKIQVPHIIKQDYLVADITNDNSVTLFNEETYEFHNEIKLNKDSNIAGPLLDKFKEDIGQIKITVLKALGEEQIIAFKVIE